jgi:hypothetical protein
MKPHLHGCVIWKRNTRWSPDMSDDTAANQALYHPLKIPRMAAARITAEDLELAETDLSAYRFRVHGYEQEILADIEKRRLKNMPTHTRPRSSVSTNRVLVKNQK